MSLLAIKILLLIIGIALIVWTVLNIIGICLEIITLIRKEKSWSCDFNVQFFVIMIATILIIVSQTI